MVAFVEQAARPHQGRRTIRIAYSGERAVGLGRDHPLLSAMGLESVFLCVRPIVLSTGAIANVEFHDLVF